MPSPHTPRRVLVVDDDDAKRYTITHPLRSLGVTLDEATSGEEALALARKDPELIILDVKLPDMDGFRVCERLKADPVTASIPVLYVSAHFRTSEDRVRGLRGGADGYLVTPINHEELIATVIVWLRVRAAERDRHRLLTALDRERAFLEQVIEQLPLGVVIADAPGGRVLFANTVAKASFGAALEEVTDVSSYAEYALLQQDLSPLPIEQYPLARALQGQDVRAFETYELRDGTLRVLSNNASPVRDARGDLVGAVAVFEDVTARRRDEEQLRVVGQLREELIGIIGHDLRNPVQAITMSLRLLESARLPGTQQNSLQRIRNSTDRIRRLIDDMVDFASARLGGRIPIRPAEVDLGMLLYEVMEELRTANPTRVLMREGDPSVVGLWDRDRLAQVVSNVIGNALQHSPGDTLVTVRLTADGEQHAVLEVHNHGAPIPAAELQSLFTPFRRAANAATAESGRSVGLGLYITHQIVLAHGGRITVRSAAETGTTFRVRLPLVSQPPA